MAEQQLGPLYAAAVGRRSDFYVPYFLRADQRGHAPKSWNWAAFFLGVLWFLYRRQFRWAAGLTAASVLMTMLAVQIDIAGLPNLAAFLLLAFSVGLYGVYVPLHANAFYYQWVRLHVEAMRRRAPQDRERQMRVLAAACRPNLHFPLLAFAAVMLLWLIAVPTLTDPSPPQSGVSATSGS